MRRWKKRKRRTLRQKRRRERRLEREQHEAQVAGRKIPERATRLVDQVEAAQR